MKLEKLKLVQWTKVGVIFWFVKSSSDGRRAIYMIWGTPLQGLLLLSKLWFVSLFLERK